MSHSNDVEMHCGSHGSIKAYVVGFIISIILTIVPFVIVGQSLLTGASLFIAISVLALVQLLVQLVYFLHLNLSSESRWNLMAFIFTLVVVFILIAGTIWIIVSLDYNMMH
jgi:cytochrome o ubiquinol oxidase operon protein cyoD